MRKSRFVLCRSFETRHVMCTGAGEQLSWPIVVAEKAQAGNHMEGRKAYADRLTVVTGPRHARARMFTAIC